MMFLREYKQDTNIPNETKKLFALKKTKEIGIGLENNLCNYSTMGLSDTQQGADVAQVVEQVICHLEGGGSMLDTYACEWDLQ